MELLPLADQKKQYISAFIAFSVVSISVFHFITLPGEHNLHNLLSELYYIPIFLSALLFGLRGAVLTYLFISVFYLPYVYISWTGTFSSEINKFLHIILQGILSLMAGLLMNRFKKQREQVEEQQYLAGLGRASASIAHDLKNPLITIQGYTRRMLDKKGDQDNALDIIASSADTMHKIIHDVLDFSRPLQLNLQKENVCGMVDRAAQACMEKAYRSNVTLSISGTDMPAFFVADGYLIERVLSNLIANSIEASESGSSVTVTVIPGHNTLQIKIKDQGVGMDRKALKYIFIPFYTRKKGGTGLGMAIAKKIIAEHKGTIFIKSEAGSGTEVTVELPRQEKRKEGQFIRSHA